jgi:hypothetical protein
LGIYYNVSIPNARKVEPVYSSVAEKQIAQMHSNLLEIKQEHQSGMSSVHVALIILLVFLLVGCILCCVGYARAHSYTTRIKRRLSKSVKDIDAKLGSSVLPALHAIHDYVMGTNVEQPPPEYQVEEQREQLLQAQMPSAEPPIVRRVAYPLGAVNQVLASSTRSVLQRTASEPTPANNTTSWSAVLQSAASFPESANFESGADERTPTAAELFKEPERTESLTPSSTRRQFCCPPHIYTFIRRPALSDVDEWEEARSDIQNPFVQRV